MHPPYTPTPATAPLFGRFRPRIGDLPRSTPGSPRICIILSGFWRSWPLTTWKSGLARPVQRDSSQLSTKNHLYYYSVNWYDFPTSVSEGTNPSAPPNVQSTHLHNNPHTPTNPAHIQITHANLHSRISLSPVFNILLGPIFTKGFFLEFLYTD